MEKRILTGQEAAEYLHIAYETLRSKCITGEIPLKPIDSIRKGCFDKRAIDAWLDKQSGLDKAETIDWDSIAEKQIKEALNGK